MPDERHKYESLPIPTYEEATSSRPQSPSSHQGQAQQQRQRQQRGDEAQLHRLLGFPPQNGSRQSHYRRRGNYEPPTVESERSSYDSDFTSPEVSDDEDEGLRQHMEEMDVLDPTSERRAQQRTGRLRLPKSFQSLRNSLSFIHLPSLPTGFPTFQSLTSCLPSIPYHLRIPLPILARLFGLFLLVALVYGLMISSVFGSARPLMGPRYTFESVSNFVLSHVNPQQIEDYLRDISYDDHIAGTQGDFFLASKIRNHFDEAHFDLVSEENYQVYLNYPKKHGRKVSIVHPPELQWVAHLEEDLSRSQKKKHPAPVFHGHSKSGNVTGPLIYANYGSREDFAFLQKQGIDLKGSIVLVRYYGTQGDRALKVKAAELAGAAGCLIYSDPADDGSGKGRTFPEGRWRPEDSVQRGSVSLMSWVVGDVLSPGWASLPGAKRMKKEGNPGLVNIPSLPLSWRDAKVLLKALQGVGLPASEDWVGGAREEFVWWTGNSSTSPIVNLKNLLDENEKQPIRNIIGRYQGYDTPNKTIYVGNHRDAWCFGAVDPGSGTAVLLEVVRVFGELRRRGWQPRRSIAFASWDAEEYNLIGSTEHVEEHMDEIRSDGIAYLNVDSAVSGHKFWADASPVFKKPLYNVLSSVFDPRDNESLLEKWNKSNSKLGGLGAGSDYVAFQDLAGCSSIDFGFTGPKHGFPYHSCYDSFKWMKRIGDPDFLYHSVAAQVWILLILELADTPIVPFDMLHYASEVARYVEDLKKVTQENLDVAPLEEAANEFQQSALAVDAWEMHWASDEAQMLTILEMPEQAQQRAAHNELTSRFETNLLDLAEDEDREGGVPGRNQFKHVIFGPQAWSGYEEAYFPAVRDAVDEGNWEAAQVQVGIAAKVIKEAARKLQPNGAGRRSL